MNLFYHRRPINYIFTDFLHTLFKIWGQNIYLISHCPFLGSSKFKSVRTYRYIILTMQFLACPSRQTLKEIGTPSKTLIPLLFYQKTLN